MTVVVEVVVIAPEVGIYAVALAFGGVVVDCVVVAGLPCGNVSCSNKNNPSNIKSGTNASPPRSSVRPARFVFSFGSSV